MVRPDVRNYVHEKLFSVWGFLFGVLWGGAVVCFGFFVCLFGLLRFFLIPYQQFSLLSLLWNVQTPVLWVHENISIFKKDWVNGQRARKCIPKGLDGNVRNTIVVDAGKHVESGPHIVQTCRFCLSSFSGCHCWRQSPGLERPLIFSWSNCITESKHYL